MGQHPCAHPCAHPRRSIELWFLYSLVWSVAATVDEEGRREVDSLMRELDAQV